MISDLSLNPSPSPNRSPLARRSGVVPDGGAESLLVMPEFINALLRVADATFGESPLTLVQRAEELLERWIVPFAQGILPRDTFGHMLRSRRGQAVLDKYRKDLRPIFEFYAAADTTSPDARDNTASLNLAEVLFFVADGELFDARLLHTEVTRIFMQCNLPDELDEHNQLTKEFRILEDYDDNDEDGTEICYNEFCKLLARICNCKIPPESRSGVPFETTLDNWLGLQIIPLYKSIMSDKVRGMGKSFGS